MWRGDALSDFATEQWATVEAARFSKLKLTALTERAQIALALGRQPEVVGDLEPLVARDPTLEPLTGLLMVALCRSGRQAEALEAYRRKLLVPRQSRHGPPDQTPVRTSHEVSGPSSAYRSTLAITFDDEDGRTHQVPRTVRH